MRDQPLTTNFIIKVQSETINYVRNLRRPGEHRTNRGIRENLRTSRSRPIHLPPIQLPEVSLENRYRSALENRMYELGISPTRNIFEEDDDYDMPDLVTPDDGSDEDGGW